MVYRATDLGAAATRHGAWRDKEGLI